MRYLKGTIALSETRDYPLLRRVLHSTFVTSNQLFEFMRLEYCASSRKAFENRVRRLVAHALLVRHQIRDMNLGVVYAISPAGASDLIARGEYYSGSPGRVETVGGHVQHALELNEIHLALKRTGMLARWTSESDIRSRNELTDIGYGKDYDATVEVRIGGQEHRFALEYERTPKAKARYDTIRKRIEAQTQLHHFLYIASNHDLLAFLRRRFQECSQVILFGLYRDVLADALDVPVQANRGSTTSPVQRGSSRRRQSSAAAAIGDTRPTSSSVTHWDAFAVPLRCFWGVLALRNVLSKRSLGVDYPLILSTEAVETVAVGVAERRHELTMRPVWMFQIGVRA